MVSLSRKEVAESIVSIWEGCFLNIDSSRQARWIWSVSLHGESQLIIDLKYTESTLLKSFDSWISDNHVNGYLSWILSERVGMIIEGRSIYNLLCLISTLQKQVNAANINLGFYKHYIVLDFQLDISDSFEAWMLKEDWISYGASEEEVFVRLRL